MKVLVFGIVLLIAILLGLLLRSNSDKSLCVSPDGQYRVRLEGYHFTTNRVVYNLPVQSLLTRMVAVLPGSVRARFNLARRSSTIVCTPDFPGEARLSAGFSIKGPFEALRLAVADEAGNEFDPAAQDAGHDQASFATTAPAFPRRSRHLWLRLFANAKRIAEFSIPNPAFRRHPQWQAQPIPAAATNGNLKITLTRFETWNPGAATYRQPGIYPRTVCRFGIVENHRPITDWRAVAFELFDATGNHWRSLVDSRFDKADGREIVGGFLGGLWPGEEAWKMKVEFKRIGNFAEQELLRINDLPIPAMNQFFEPKTKYRVNGARLELSSLVGLAVDWGSLFQLNRDPVYRMIPGPITNDRFTVLIKCQSQNQDRRLVLLSSTDNDHAAVKAETIFEPSPPAGLGRNDPPYWIKLSPLPGAKKVNLVFAVTRSVSVEFMVKPTQANTRNHAVWRR